MAASPQLSDPTQFESTAQVLISLIGKKKDFLMPCVEALLADSVLRRVLKEEADMGCGVLMAVLVALDKANVVFDKKLQESVQKVS